MAIDKLVDSTQLDADLTSVANAIRTKGGTSAELAFPQGFIDAVDAIPTGGGDVTLRTTNESAAWWQVSFGEGINNLTVELNYNGSNRACSFAYFSRDLSVNDTVYLVEKHGYIGSLANALQDSSFETLDVSGINSIQTTFTGTVTNNSRLKYVVGAEIDESYANPAGTYTAFPNCPNLEEVRYMPNTIGGSQSFLPNQHLSKATVISIANGLLQGASSKSIRYYSGLRTLIESIVGEIDGDGLFYEVEGGAVLLTDFITSTKGWSLAW